MIFPGFPGILSFFQVFQVQWEPWYQTCTYSSTELNLVSHNSLTILKSVIMDPVQLSLVIVTFVLYLVWQYHRVTELHCSVSEAKVSLSFQGKIYRRASITRTMVKESSEYYQRYSSSKLRWQQKISIKIKRLLNTTPCSVDFTYFFWFRRINHSNQLLYKILFT